MRVSTIGSDALTAGTAQLSIDSALGLFVIWGTENGVTHVYLPDATPPRTQDSSEKDLPESVVEAGRQLGQYLAGHRRQFDLTLDPSGTDFQRSVWFALALIPYGETVSYADLARSVGRPKAFRAVGQANGHNPLPIVLPCHRVIASGGGLGGYGGGLRLKEQLLALEAKHRSA
jgi:methylated-DNA-[protein]-cysteine S-methyltransferase